METYPCHVVTEVPSQGYLIEGLWRGYVGRRVSLDFNEVFAKVSKIRNILSFCGLGGGVADQLLATNGLKSKRRSPFRWRRGGMTRVLNKELQNADSTNSSQYLLITKSFAVSRN